MTELLLNTKMLSFNLILPGLWRDIVTPGGKDYLGSWLSKFKVWKRISIYQVTCAFFQTSNFDNQPFLSQLTKGRVTYLSRKP